MSQNKNPRLSRNPQKFIESIQHLNPTDLEIHYLSYTNFANILEFNTPSLNKENEDWKTPIDKILKFSYRFTNTKIRELILIDLIEDFKTGILLHTKHGFPLQNKVEKYFKIKKIEFESEGDEYEQKTKLAYEDNIMIDYSKPIEFESKGEDYEQKTKQAYEDNINYDYSKPIEFDSEASISKYFAKHYVLTYILECHAKGVSLPIGEKKKLEQIGNNRMGKGKGNRFYKVFNLTHCEDLNIEKNLIEIAGENWRSAVMELSQDSKSIEEYLQKKQL